MKTKKIELETPYEDIEKTFWEANILQRSGYWDVCPLFSLELDNKQISYFLNIRKKESKSIDENKWEKTFYFYIDCSIMLPDIDGDFSDESPLEQELVYQSKNYDCEYEAMEDLKAWIKEKMGELNG